MTKPRSLPDGRSDKPRSLPAPLSEVVSDFQDMAGQDKLKLLLEFADELPPLPAELSEAAMEPVPECQSPLFMHVDAGDRDDVRLFFTSNDRQEPAHIHVERDGMVAKFWLTPLRLAKSDRFAAHELGKMERIIEARYEEIMEAWNEFSRR